jgi:hypothetical protein
MFSHHHDCSDWAIARQKLSTRNQENVAGCRAQMVNSTFWRVQIREGGGSTLDSQLVVGPLNGRELGVWFGPHFKAKAK